MNDNDILNNLAQYQKIVSEIVSNPIDNKENKTSPSSTTSTTSTTSIQNLSVVGKLLTNYFFIFMVIITVIIFTYLLYKLEPSFVMNEKQISYKNGIKETNVSILLCISYSLGFTLILVTILFIIKLNLKN